MAGDWRATTIGELLDKNDGELQTGPFGSQLHAHDYDPTGAVAVVPTSAIGRRRLIPDEVQRIQRGTADKLARHYLRAGDIVFARRGVQAAGLSAFVAPEQDGWLCGTGGIRMRLPASAVDTSFLSFALSTEATYKWIRQNAVGATMPNLNEGVVREIPVVLPPLDEQRRIAAILSALDDKIELNRKMNRTLEEMAQALFKSWFIDFDGHDDLVDSEIGPVPRGWGVGRIGDVCSAIFSGGTPRTAESRYWNGPHSWLSSGETGEHLILGTDKTITAQGVAESSTRLAPSGATVVASAGQGRTRGQTSWLAIDAYINQSTIALIAHPAQVGPAWLYLNLGRRYEEMRQLSDSHSSRGSLTTKLLAGMPTVVPPPGVARSFETRARPLVDRAVVNVAESRTLAALRDTLLPKLISGEIRVPEGEKLVEEAL